MQKGFQVAHGEGVMCLLFLFENWTINTETKYILSILVTFFMGMLNELFVVSRKYVAEKTSTSSLLIKSLNSLLYGAQMVNAYWLMLLVMTYEALVFTAIILGLTVGHFLFGVILGSRIASSRKDEQGTALLGTAVTGTPCCGGSNI